MNKSYRPARVFAMQLLYAMEITGSTAEYGMKLVDLVQAHREELDEDIKTCSVHWEIDRIAKIDRIVARIAMVELLFVPDIPVKVALSEAVQIGAKYSTDSSGAFVNGLLSGFMSKRGINVGIQNKKDK